VNWLSAQANQFIPISVSNTWSYEGQHSSVFLVEKDTVIDFKKTYKVIERDGAKGRVDYFSMSNDSVFTYKIKERKFIFAHKQNLGPGDSLTYREAKGMVVSVKAKIKTPVSQYSDLIKVKWHFPDGVILFGYYKPGIGSIAHETEDGILAFYLVKYKVK
jgi:hypothetical protein